MSKSERTILIGSIYEGSTLISSFALFSSIVFLIIEHNILYLFISFFSVLFLLVDGVRIRYFHYTLKDGKIQKRKHFLLSKEETEINLTDIEDVEEVGFMNSLNDKIPFFQIPFRLRKTKLVCSTEGSRRVSHIIVSKSFYEKVKSGIISHRI